MRLDIEPLMLAAERLAQTGHLKADTFERRRSTLSMLESRLVTKQEHVAAYEESRAQLTLDGSQLAWARWRAENQLLVRARAEVERLEVSIRFEMEMLEHEVALAQQRQARALADADRKEARA